MIRTLFLIFIGLCFSPTFVLAGQIPKVVTSIQPLQLITNQVMAGVGQADVLIDANQSPHHFQLKPSQLDKLRKLDLLIWISDEFETGLAKLQRILPTANQRLELIKYIPQNQLIGDHPHEIDGHIWLAPENVIVISQRVAEHLSQLDPDNQVTYQNNSLRLIEQIKRWRQKSFEKLQVIQPRYILEHQFLNYFEQSFELHNGGSLRDSHDHSSSLRQLNHLHDHLKQEPVSCLLVSELPISRQAEQIRQQYSLQLKVLRILNEDNQQQTIIDLLDSIVTALEDCQ